MAIDPLPPAPNPDDPSTFDTLAYPFTAALQNMVSQINAVLNQFEIETPPIGIPYPFAGTTAPANYLLCQGQAISRTTYAKLFGVIGTTWGAGNGSTTFNLPDFRGRVLVGAGAASGVTTRAVGATGGAETVALTAAQLASHTHSVNLTTSQDGIHTHSYRNSKAFDQGDVVANRADFGNGQGLDNWYDTPKKIGDAGAHTHTVTGNTGAQGDGVAHNNMQPFAVVNYIIRVA